MFPRILMVFASLLLVNCLTTPIYVPPTVNAPLLRNEGEFHLAGTFYVGSYNAHLAYAFTDVTAFAVNFQRVEFGEFSQTIGEIGLGAYTPLGNWFAAEIFGGGGYGRSIYVVGSDPDSEYQTSFQANVAKAYWQLNFGFVSSVMDFGVAPRLTYAQYTGDRADDSIIDVNNTYYGYVAFLRLGWRQVKGVLQIGIEKELHHREDLELIEVVGAIGIHMTLGRNY